MSVEDKMIGVLINTIAPDLKKVTSENDVAKFVEDNASKIFAVSGEGKEISELLCKTMVSYANTHPDTAIQKMLEFYESFRIWYRVISIQKGENI